MNQTVFVNRTLNSKKIKYIGLDMDHTLVRYHTKNFESLVYDMVIQKLIQKKHYPQAIEQFKFTLNDAIRGLIIDSKNGNILKLSRYAAIRQSFHGTKEISFTEQKKIYHSIYVDLKDPNYMAIDTSFSIAFCVLYSQLVDFKDEHPDSLPSYSTIALDVLSMVDETHADGTLKAVISESIEKFVIRDKAVVEGLKRYTHFGKKFFLLTNSDYYYVNLLLTYCITPFMEEGKTWHELFEFVITSAHKPRFFYDDLGFLAVNPADGTMTNTYGVILPGIYQGGNARKFTQDLKLSGDEILYIGDHIYGDILRLKKDCNWRTALVVEELGQEIASQTQALPVERKIVEAMKIKTTMEQESIDYYTYCLDNKKNDESKLKVLQAKINALDKKISELLREERAFYNPRWGRIFRAGAEESYFAYQVDRYACIYMEKFSDLLEHSPMTYFRAHRRLMAHDVCDF